MAEKDDVAPSSSVLAKNNRKFVVRRDGTLTPLNGVNDEEEADERLRREISDGQVKEIDLYVYIGTYRPKRTAEKVDVFDPDTP